MQVKLLDHTRLSNAVVAARTCWDSFHKGGNYQIPTDEITEDDKSLLERLNFKLKHQSVMEHIVYNFSIKGISRACLQELARHRIASYSVKSTRYTLKELKDLPAPNYNDLSNYAKYIVLTQNFEIDKASIDALYNLSKQVRRGVSLDILKYNVPECYKTDLVWTINVRSLSNFFNLRLSKSAHPEIRELAGKVKEALPTSHQFLFRE